MNAQPTQQEDLIEWHVSPDYREGGSAFNDVVYMQVLNRSSGVSAFSCARMDSNMHPLAGMGCDKCPGIASTIAPVFF